MENNIIYEFIDRFEKSELSVMKIETKDLKLHLEKNTPEAVNCESNRVKTISVAENKAPDTTESKVETDSCKKVKSPIVGVFYEAPSPQEKPYVQLGDKVEKGQILCLVEAMKMMNELKSPVSGVVKKISGKNGEMVEFDQVLFEVEEC